MRDFLLGVVAVTLFGFLVLWKLPSPPRGPGGMVGTETSAHAPVAAPPTLPVVVEPGLAPLIPPAQHPTVAEPILVLPELAATPPPAAIEATPAPTTAITPRPKMDAEQAPSGVARSRATRLAKKPETPRVNAIKPATARAAQRPVNHAKKSKGR